MTSIHKYRSIVLSFFTLLLLSGCKIDLSNINCALDRSSCDYAGPYPTPYPNPYPTPIPEPYPQPYQSTDFTHGKVEVDPSSTLSFTPSRVTVFSGVCKSPMISVFISGDSDYRNITLQLASFPQVGQDYNLFQSGISSQISLFGASIADLKEAKINFQEVPTKLTSGGDLKFSGHLVMKNGKVFDFKFQGIVPVPVTSDTMASTADPYQCEKESIAYSDLEKERLLADKCNQSSDCVISNIELYDSCGAIAINGNAANFNDLAEAAHEYNSVVKAQDSCGGRFYKALPSCTSGRCNYFAPPIFYGPID